jgi:hypothetical protein
MSFEITCPECNLRASAMDSSGHDPIWFRWGNPILFL